jgi:hypothetical protein
VEGDGSRPAPGRETLLRRAAAEPQNSHVSLPWMLRSGSG